MVVAKAKRSGEGAHQNAKDDKPAMTKDQRILKAYQTKLNPAAAAIKVDSNFFYDIVDADGKVLYSGDLAKYDRSSGDTRKLK
jgi:hypothetical protein